MSLEDLQLEDEGKGEKVSQDEVAAKAADLSNIDNQIKQVAEAKDPKVAEALRNDPELRAEILQFIQLAANNSLDEHTAEFNAKNFDKDGEDGLDKFEFDQFADSLDAAIDQILILDGLEAFKEVHTDSGETSWYEVDKHLADGANFLTDGVLDGLIGDEKDGNLAERMLNGLDFSDEEIKAMRDKPFSVSSAESWKELSILLALELGEGVEDIIRFLINIPSSVVLLPRYLYLRTQTHSDDPKEVAAAEIKLAELTGENPALGLLDLLGEKGVEAIKQIGAMMTSGKQGDIALATVSAAGLIAGGAGALKIGARAAKFKKVESVAGKVQRKAEKVDDIVGGAGIGHLTGGYKDRPKQGANDNITEGAVLAGGVSHVNKGLDKKAGEVKSNHSKPRLGNKVSLTRSDGSLVEGRVIGPTKDSPGYVDVEIPLSNGKSLIRRTSLENIENSITKKAGNDNYRSAPDASSIGETALIKRSDGRTHEATIKAIDPKGNITFEWQENGQTLTKKVSKETFQANNPKPKVKPPIKPKLPKAGETALIKRSDGRTHEAIIKSVDEHGNITFQWQENGQTLTKKVSKEKFNNTNKNHQRETPKKSREVIGHLENIESFDDLFNWINKQEGGIQGSNGLIKKQELVDMINDVRSGELPLDNITRTGGLRAKVRVLVKKEKNPARINRERLVKKLWPNGIDSHLMQGHVGNCYFIAALRGVKSHEKAQKILIHMVQEQADGSIIVRFPGDKAQRPIPISKRDLDEMASKGLKGDLGDRILERAYARLVREQKENVIDGKRSGRTTLIDPEKQMAFEGGHAYKSFKEMFGDFFKEEVIENYNITKHLRSITPQNKDDFILSFSSKRKEVSSGRSDSHKYQAKDVNGQPLDLYHGHAYGVENIDIANQRILIVNPHNTAQQRFWMSFQQAQDSFDTIKGGILDNDRMLDAINSGNSEIFNQANPDAWMYHRAA